LTKRYAPFRCVLVPTDFSDCATQALQRALRLPLASGARLHLLHAIPARLPAAERRQARAHASRQLDKLVAHSRERNQSIRDAQITTGIMSGRPFVEIIRCARGIGAELVVIGRHGSRSFRDLLVGTTAERVIRKSDGPTLVVSQAPTSGYRRPLVAVDLEDASRRLVDLALRALGNDPATLRLVHAYSSPLMGFTAMDSSDRTLETYRRSAERQARARLKKLMMSLGDTPGRFTSTAVCGEPRSVILNEGRRHRSDLIVIGTHSRSGLAHALLGSVAEGVLAAATCDLLVARPARFSFALP